MGYYSRLTKSFEGALRLPLTERSKYVLFSDCHRGTGTSYDNFIKNRNLYFASLQYYYKYGYTYIELGDGDELWENRSMEPIIEAHSNVFELLREFEKRNRLYMLYGNHDMVKKNTEYIENKCYVYQCNHKDNSPMKKQPLFLDTEFHSGIILENSSGNDIYLTHGHQAEALNSTFWLLARFLVRYFWKPIERFGVLDPTSAAKDYTRKHKAEQRLHRWAQKENHTLITGHTHRPSLSEEDKYYYNRDRKSVV